MSYVSPGRASAPQGALWLVLAAGLMGAVGVALAAVAAHRLESPALATAAMMLMVHAAAVLALAGISLAVEQGRSWRGVAALMLSSVALFSGDVAVHAITGSHLFPYAAPTGGSLTILSWVLVALAAGCALLKSAGASR
jgi:uncharacterized membrane protein YgdD (TMEM256/DUF423 family)